ncbi:MAG: sigma 54-interacting transcriptional regulator [Desulfuromonadales bacterium]
MKKAHILIVDDEESIRFTFEAFLRAEGYAVTCAADYKGAVALLEHAEFDVVFADILLGSNTGLDLLREVKRRGLLAPVILFSGSPDVESATEAVRLGAYDYIPKPITRSILLRVSRMAMTFSALEKEKENYRLHLEAIFHSVKDGIITVDRELRIGEFNPAAGRLVGLARHHIGKTISAPDLSWRRNWLTGLQDCLESGRPVELSRLRNQTDKGEGQVFSLLISPLIDPRGRHAGAVTVVRDETRLEFLERDLNARRQFQRMTSQSRQMQEIFRLIETLADLDTTVLVTGESGTGKELVAEALHFGGERRKQPLVKINCNALMDNLLESELFGHVRGAFTGAFKDKVGRFEKADGGTLFLDEIGDISPLLQAKLLRVLQEKEFERVGDSTPVRVNVRIVAATNQDLVAKVKKGEFRQDLYYRLKVVNVHLPPLRERLCDMALLTEFFVAQFSLRQGKYIERVRPEVLDRFLAHDWPGNIRELEHAIEHACILTPGPFIGLEHLSADIRSIASPSSPAETDPCLPEAFRVALVQTGGNKAKAARLLGISRKTLYRKLGALPKGENA